MKGGDDNQGKCRIDNLSIFCKNGIKPSTNDWNPPTISAHNLINCWNYDKNEENKKTNKGCKSNLAIHIEEPFFSV